MTENATCFGARRGVGPPRHPSTMRGGASRLPKVPDRHRFGLEEGAIRRIQANVSNRHWVSGVPAKPAVGSKSTYLCAQKISCTLIFVFSRAPDIQVESKGFRLGGFRDSFPQGGDFAMPKAYSLDLRERVARFVGSGRSRHAA
jgi:hypothetical protein